jgi:hypothetical protein
LGGRRERKRGEAKDESGVMGMVEEVGGVSGIESLSRRK